MLGHGQYALGQVGQRVTIAASAGAFTLSGSAANFALKLPIGSVGSATELTVTQVDWVKYDNEWLLTAAG